MHNYLVTVRSLSGAPARVWVNAADRSSAQEKYVDQCEAWGEAVCAIISIVKVG